MTACPLQQRDTHIIACHSSCASYVQDAARPIHMDTRTLMFVPFDDATIFYECPAAICRNHARCSIFLHHCIAQYNVAFSLILSHTCCDYTVGCVGRHLTVLKFQSATVHNHPVVRVVADFTSSCLDCGVVQHHQAVAPF